jgi:hypothetical protein
VHLDDPGHDGVIEPVRLGQGRLQQIELSGGDLNPLADVLGKPANLSDGIPVLLTLAAHPAPLAGDLDTLRTLATSGAGWSGVNRFEALLEAGLILPILDGLDEVPEAARPLAITQINNELRPGEQVVVTCRTEQYQAMVSPQDGQGATLRAAAVQLRTLQIQ